MRETQAAWQAGTGTPTYGLTPADRGRLDASRPVQEAPCRKTVFFKGGVPQGIGPHSRGKATLGRRSPSLLSLPSGRVATRLRPLSGAISSAGPPCGERKRKGRGFPPFTGPSCRAALPMPRPPVPFHLASGFPSPDAFRSGPSA